jgi:integrase/recombinase XerD
MAPRGASRHGNRDRGKSRQNRLRPDHHRSRSGHAGSTSGGAGHRSQARRAVVRVASGVDVSLVERVVTIRQGKGGKRREVPIRRDLAQLLRLHIGARRAGPLFASRQEGSGPTPHVLTRQRVGQIVRAIAVAAGISKRVYPHLLRHTVATRLLALGLDITDLQRFLGHESIATTRLYAETTAATLQRRFDQLTDPTAHVLISGIRQKQGDEAAILAADLLAQRRAERLTTAGA